MKDYRSIIVGVDLNAEHTDITLGAQKAIRQAVWVALANKASIHFVFSSYTDSYVSALRGSAGVVHEGLTDAAREVLETVVSGVRDGGVEAELVITSDRPWIDISKLVIQKGTDLVVVGKRNETSDGGRPLGNTAVKLLRKCPCSVWVVRPEHDLVQRLVLAATDLTEVGDRAVEAAANIALRQQCELNVIHAWQVPIDLQMQSSRMSEEDYAKELERLKQGVVDHIQNMIPASLGDKVEIHAVKAAPAQGIQDAVERLDPDLLVMGTVSRTGIAGLLVGSTAERMLDQVDCSILTLKPKGFESPIHG